MNFIQIKSALLGVTSDGKHYLIDDDQGKPIAPAWQTDSSGNVTGLLGPAGVPAGVPWELVQTGFPVGLAPNGTIATAGAVTLGTALPTTYSGGIWLYFPAGAVSGDATGGLYWCVMSSPTAGTVYEPKVDTSTGFVPYAGSAAAAVTGSNSAYTQTTGSDITLVRFTLPANSLGARGRLRFNSSITGINNANTKQFKWIWATGSAIIWAQTTITTAAFFGTYPVEVRNRGTARQIASNWGASLGTTNPLAYTAIDTTAAQGIIATAQLATATDFIILEGFGVEVIYND